MAPLKPPIDGASEMASAPAAEAVSLHPHQQQAIENVRAHALSLLPEATSNIVHILRMSNIPTARFEAALKSVRSSARVALHFHPDRPVPGGDTVARELLRDGTYRSQFETGISNGSVSARTGGARDEWERMLFGGAYHGDVPTQFGEPVENPGLRPRYGALDLMRSGDGPAPRFGSCFLVLRPAASQRCTFTFGDSSSGGPRWRATLNEIEAVLSPLLEESFVRGSALGVEGVRPPELVRRLAGVADEEGGYGPMRGNLDHVVEAQVHGEVQLDRDVDQLVADASFRGDETTGRDLEMLAARYGIGLRWHAGFRIRVGEVPDDFRGPTMPSLAARVAGEAGIVDARAIGKAARELATEPAAWADRGTYAEVLQELKLLWHVLVRYGRGTGHKV